MPQENKPTHCYLHTFTVPCAVHGTHSYVLGGLDHAVDDAAFYLLKVLRRNHSEPLYERIDIPLEIARRVWGGGGIDYDDLPY